MQIIFLLIEIFLPEIAAKLSGGDAKVVQKKILRTGLGLILLALFVTLIAVCLQVFYYRLPLRQIDLLSGGPFTAFVLFAIGMVLVFVSNVGPAVQTPDPIPLEEPPGSENTNHTSVQGNIADIWSHYRSGKHGLIAQNPLKLKSIRMADCLCGIMPNEAWMFSVAGRDFLVINNLETGCQLWMDENLVDQNSQKMRFGLHEQPRLSANISGADGNQYQVAVFFQARLHIGLRVLVNGCWLNEQFV